MDGLLIIDKPEGPTSHDVVARVRRLFDESRVGHTGTLDPLATGVLPVVLGKATRLARFLTSTKKQYRAAIRIGRATDTYDRLGGPTGAAADVSGVTADDIERALERFRGTFAQTPPAYSAKKLGGVASHRLARRGDAVTPAAVVVTVDRLALLSLDADLVTLDLTCSAGFYVRSLAHDLGQALGCGAHLAALRRTASGEFGEADSVPLDVCERDREAAHARVRPMAALLAWAPAIVLRAGGRARVQQGQALRPEDVARAEPGTRPLVDRLADGRDEAFVRVLDEAGALLALAVREAPPSGARAPDAAGAAVPGLLHPRIVLV